jgi:hypothetical protein
VLRLNSWAGGCVNSPGPWPTPVCRGGIGDGYSLSPPGGCQAGQAVVLEGGVKGLQTLPPESVLGGLGPGRLGRLQVLPGPVDGLGQLLQAALGPVVGLPGLLAPGQAGAEDVGRLGDGREGGNPCSRTSGGLTSADGDVAALRRQATWETSV